MKKSPPKAKRLPPGHVIFTSDEVEWLMTNLVLAVETVEQLGLTQPEVMVNTLDKIDRARFVDAVERLIPKTTRDAALRAAKAALRRK